MAVVVSSNIVRMAFYLVVSLGAVAGLFFLAGADFVGAMQLMIYVGGTLVLLVFGVMLTAQGPFVIDEDQRRRVDAGRDRRRLRCWPCCCRRPFSVDDWAAPASASAAQRRRQPTAAPLGHGPARRPRRSARPDQTPTLRGGMSGYLLPFEIVSVHLLVVLVGAAYLARARTRGVDDHRSEPPKLTELA